MSLQLFFKMGKRGDLIAHTAVEGHKVIALYDRAEPNPVAGLVDVVITGQSRNGRTVFVARKDGLIPVRHTGFRCSGSMCRTTAATLDLWGGQRQMVTPGPAPVQVAWQLNGQDDKPRPGTV